MSTTQTLETKTLIEAMESRAKEYRLLRDQFQELKTSFKDIVDLDDFKGKTADSVKGFYRAQIDVVNSWMDFIDLQEAFFKGIKGMADDEDLGGKTLVHLPFLDSDLKNSESRARQMVDSQEQALEDIFSGISDLVSMEPNSTKQFDKHIDEATKKRKETKEKVENFDQTLLEFYEQSKYHENVIAGLISELYKASSQGGEVNPLYFNEDAYKKSDIHTAKKEAKEITANYISWQDELEKARELENRSFGEKTWDTICTFTGEVTGYYDMKRASTGVDPVTGQELTDGQRATAAALAAAGFIPFVGWAGRAAKGGHAIYKTSKTFSAADNVLNAYKTTEAFDILKTSERGLYGLASANGFSEYITGRDIFGNPISEEEQQAGFERALLLLPFKGKTANPVLGVRDDARGVSKGTDNYRQIDFTRGFDVDPKYSTYEQRVKTTPVNKGEWSNERAESLFISDKTGEIKKYLDEAGVDGVEYKNGMPDFSPFSKGEIKLENMTNDRKSNFSTADEELAKKWSTPEQKWTAEDIADWREDNKYTWHELNDLETIQLVPSKINSVFKHLGGVGEYNIKVKLGE